MDVEKEFKINEYISLKLEYICKDNHSYTKTYIYIAERRFIQCKFLLLINPHEKDGQDEINSIDEASEKLISKLERDVLPRDIGLSPEEEFWGHCSNLQAFAEYGYDTRLIHRNLAFPLLKKLVDVGDPLAKRMFLDEIAKRIDSNYEPVILFLINGGYLDYFSDEEFDVVVQNPSLSTILRNKLITYRESNKNLLFIDKLFKFLDTLYFSGQYSIAPHVYKILVELLNLLRPRIKSKSVSSVLEILSILNDITSVWEFHLDIMSDITQLLYDWGVPWDNPTRYSKYKYPYENLPYIIKKKILRMFKRVDESKYDQLFISFREFIRNLYDFIKIRFNNHDDSSELADLIDVIETWKEDDRLGAELEWRIDNYTKVQE